MQIFFTENAIKNFIYEIRAVVFGPQYQLLKIMTTHTPQILCPQLQHMNII